MWSLFKKQKDRREREEALQIKVAQSQLALLEAATTTADAAQHVTNALRGQLSDSLKQFEITARLISDALIICDFNGHIKAFNPTAETIFATTFTEVERKSVSELFRLNGKVPEFSDLLIAIDNHEGLMNSPLQGYRCNNEAFVIDASASLLDREDGSVLFLLLIRDMSDTIEQQNEIKTFKDRFQQLFDLSFDGILIIQNSIIVAANKKAASLFGMDENTLLHSPSNTLLEKINNDGQNQKSKFQKDGVLIDMRFSSTGITWNGSPARLVTVKCVNQRNI